jgi:hypothetical protein
MGAIIAPYPTTGLDNAMSEWSTENGGQQSNGEDASDVSADGTE